MPGISFFQGGGSSLQTPLEAPTVFSAGAGNAQVSLTWTDPKDKYATPEGEQAQDPQQLVSVWAYTKIVRKVGSAPTSPNDGVTVVSSSVRNQYQSAPFVDTGLTNDVMYFYGAFSFNADGVASPGTFIGAKPVAISVYGVEWNGTDTTKWTRIGASANFPDPSPAVNNGAGSSPFDNLLPWSGMVTSEDPEAGTLVAIPKFWYRWTTLNPGIRLEIADGPVDGFYVSPAHADRGDGKGERDVVYVGRYHCVDSSYKSETGKYPNTERYHYSSRNICRNLGENIWMWDWQMNWTIKMLYLVEFADWNSQDTIGYGCESNVVGTSINGLTDNMRYHTGTNVSSRTSYGAVQYRNIEGLWSGVYDWVDGCYYDYNGLNIINNPSDFSDDSGGTLIGKPISSASYPSKLSIGKAYGGQWLYPIEENGSSSTYVPDAWSFYASNNVLYVGSNSQSLTTGLFFVNYANDVYRSDSIGYRLQKLP